MQKTTTHRLIPLHIFFRKASFQNKKAAISALMKEAVLPNTQATSNLYGWGHAD